MGIEPERIFKLNEATDHPERQYVLYWAQMNRRVDSNHGLLYAVELANRFNLPVLYYEGLTCTYQYANDRLHTFILQNVPETARRLEKAGVGYVFYLRKTKADSNHTFYDLAKDAAAVVTDDYPTFIARQHNASVPAKLDVSYYVVDSSCIVPMRVFTKREYGAYTIRPKINRVRAQYLKPADALHVKHRFKAKIPSFHTPVTERSIPDLVAACEIDHAVRPSTTFAGGRLVVEAMLEHFLTENLRRYAKGRNQPSEHATSDMSPYLHFGQISSLEIALAVSEYAEKHKLIADEYLEELIVRRELSFNYARFVDCADRLENLPNWCQKTMQKHAADARYQTYTHHEMEKGETGDELWNASQKELLLRGKIHGYYRMYWGKKILEWSPTYQEAVDVMVEFHDRFALDGRDPNTYTNILWCFGLHDRPWGERPVFGQLRYMSSEGMKRKTAWKAYIEEIQYLEATGKDRYKVAG